MWISRKKYEEDIHKSNSKGYVEGYIKGLSEGRADNIINNITPNLIREVLGLSRIENEEKKDDK